MYFEAAFNLFKMYYVLSIMEDHCAVLSFSSSVHGIILLSSDHFIIISSPCWNAGSISNVYVHTTVSFNIVLL